MLGVSPPDEYGLYEAPVVTAVTVSVANPVKLIGIDPTRVSLIIGLGTVTTCFIYPGETNMLASGGILLNNASIAFIQFSYIDHPALCQSAWSVQTNPGAGNLTVVSVSLRRPPEMYGYDLFRKRNGILPGSGFVSPRGAAKVAGSRRPIPGGILGLLRERYPALFQ